MTFIVKFYLNDKMMRQMQIESDTIGKAVKEAIDMCEGYFFWDRIRVETL
jgi:hypothetical protein